MVALRRNTDDGSMQRSRLLVRVAVMDHVSEIAVQFWLGANQNLPTALGAGAG